MKENSTIYIILAVIVVIIGVGWLGSTRVQTNQTSSSQASPNNSILSALEKMYDFGSISMKDGLVKHEFVVVNSTREDITISTVQTSCMCTTALVVNSDGSTKGPFGMPGMGYVPPANEVIKAGESRIIRVVYDPNAHGPAGVGAIDRFVTLTDSNSGALQFEIKANVIP